MHEEIDKLFNSIENLIERIRDRDFPANHDLHGVYERTNANLINIRAKIASNFVREDGFVIIFLNNLNHDLDTRINGFLNNQIENLNLYQQVNNFFAGLFRYFFTNYEAIHIAPDEVEDYSINSDNPDQLSGRTYEVGYSINSNHLHGRIYMYPEVPSNMG